MHCIDVVFVGVVFIGIVFVGIVFVGVVFIGVVFVGVVFVGVVFIGVVFVGVVFIANSIHISLLSLSDHLDDDNSDANDDNQSAKAGCYDYCRAE